MVVFCAKYLKKLGKKKKALGKYDRNRRAVQLKWKARREMPGSSFDSAQSAC